MVRKGEPPIVQLRQIPEWEWFNPAWFMFRPRSQNKAGEAQSSLSRGSWALNEDMEGFHKKKKLGKGDNEQKKLCPKKGSVGFC